MSGPDDSAPASPPRGSGAEPCPEAGLLHRLAELARHELDSAELTVAGGDMVRIVDLSEVEQWLQGWAVRLRNGTRP